MKQFVVRPVATTYDPGYPRFTEVTDWASLLAADRPRVQRVAALFAGILGSCLLVAEGQAADAPDTHVHPPLRSPNAEAARIANEVLDEVRPQDSWFSSATVKKVQVVERQPKITVPQIRISFGNSYAGIFDVTRARRATLQVFAAYGVKLETNHHFKREGIEFEADGYDPVKKVGFEILGSDRKQVDFDLGEPDGPAASVLDDAETAALKQRVASGKDTLFLAPATAYPNMDGDQFTPLRAYLQSTLDYLDWLARSGKLK